ncbi:MAG TPA: hypothetical protein VLD40_00575 [Dissulfurispiraceae bacterium]|nr:hypothetical protein [Dissulfurispiraceae bacterium]
MALLFIPFSAVLLALFLLWPNDERRISRLFGDGARAVRTEDLEEVMSHVSLTYKDDAGLTYLSLRPALKRLFTSFSDIVVEYELRQISVSDSAASADLYVTVSAAVDGENVYVLGDGETPTRLVFALEREKGKWLVTRCGGLAGVVRLD